MPDASNQEPQLQVAHGESPVERQPDAVALARLLDEWMQGDESAQRETFEFLRHALDDQRPAGYKLFS